MNRSGVNSPHDSSANNGKPALASPSRTKLTAPDPSPSTVKQKTNPIFRPSAAPSGNSRTTRSIVSRSSFGSEVSTPTTRQSAQSRSAALSRPYPWCAKLADSGGDKCRSRMFPPRCTAPRPSASASPSIGSSVASKAIRKFFKPRLQPPSESLDAPRILSIQPSPNSLRPPSSVPNAPPSVPNECPTFSPKRVPHPRGVLAFPARVGGGLHIASVPGRQGYYCGFNPAKHRPACQPPIHDHGPQAPSSKLIEPCWT